MARQRNPERDLSLKRYLESDGKVTTAELAKLAGVTETQIRKWKSLDRWQEALKQKGRKRGGQPGNKNASGKTPKKNGNKNAMTHGAFVSVGYDDVPVELAEEIKNFEPDSMLCMAEEMKSLLLRKVYLEGLLSEYSKAEESKFYTDKIVEMIVPKSEDDKEAKSDSVITQTRDPESGSREYKTTVKSIVKSSAFERAMKIEGELNKVHGRIIKLIDSLKSKELEERRLSLEEKKYKLAKDKANGIFDDDVPLYDENDTESVPVE